MFSESLYEFWFRHSWTHEPRPWTFPAAPASDLSFHFLCEVSQTLSIELAQNLGLQTSMIPKSDLKATSFLWRHNEVNIRFQLTFIGWIVIQNPPSWCQRRNCCLASISIQFESVAVHPLQFVLHKPKVSISVSDGIKVRTKLNANPKLLLKLQSIETLFTLQQQHDFEAVNLKALCVRIDHLPNSYTKQLQIQPPTAANCSCCQLMSSVSRAASKRSMHCCSVYIQTIIPSCTKWLRASWLAC